MPKRPQISELQLESYRLTLFHPHPQAEFDHGLFREVFGQEPIISQVQNLPQRVLHAEVVRNRVKYTMDFNPLSVHFNLMGTDQIDPSTGEQLPMLGFETARPLVLDLWNRIISNPKFGTTLRFALAPTLVIPVVDHNTGYTKLSQYLPFAVDGRTTREFSLQINKPLPKKFSDGKEYTLNALIIASVVQMATFNISVGLPDAQGLQPVTSYRTRLSFDINNQPETGLQLNQDRLKELFAEFSARLETFLLDGISI